MSIFPINIIELADSVVTLAGQRKERLVLVESCTGGLLAAILTEISGVSHVFECGFVTYTNHAKTRYVGVPEKCISREGAVSREVSIEMAEGALRYSVGTLSIAITGIAGPGGGSTSKPVGLVHIALGRRHKDTIHQEYRFSGDRSAIRLQAVERALLLIQSALG